MLGLDRFKAVNDSLGLLTADRLLVAVADRLQASLRATDAVSRAEHGFTLARLGGDEFTVLLDDITDVSDAVRVAERLRRALEEPFEVDGQQVFTSASVGIAVSTHRLRAAGGDSARRRHRAASREGGRSEPLRDLRSARCASAPISRLQVETDLRSAIENREFEVHYQPIVSLATGEIIGVRGAGALAPPRARAAQPGRVHLRSRKTPG